TQGDRPRSDRPQGDRPRSDRPQGERPRTDRPRTDRPRNDDRRSTFGLSEGGSQRPRRSEQREGASAA
ncbi:MAG: ATP-dependent helicase, partial [Acidobacteriota bacterium]